MKTRLAKQKHLGVTILALALTAVLLVTACAQPTTSPTGEKKVEVGALPVLTGAGTSADQPCFRGLQAYIEYFNEEKGIPGMPIEVVWRDSGTGNPPQFISSYRVLYDRGVPIFYTSTPSAADWLKQQVEKDQLPLILGGVTGEMVYPPGWVFPVWATPGEASVPVLDYFMQNWKEERAPRLQAFVMDGVFGREPVSELTKYAESIGFEVLPLEVSPYVILDATPQLLRMQDRGADLVWQNQLITGGGPIMRDAERLGLEDEMQFAGTEWILGEQLIEMAPVGAEGLLATRSLPWVDEADIPGVKTMTDRQQVFLGEPTYMAGWVYGAIMCETVRLAIEEVGYENLDGLAAKRALESMDLDVDGMVRITFGPEDRRGTRDYAVYQIKGGKIVRITDWQEVPILVP